MAEAGNIGLAVLAEKLEKRYGSLHAVDGISFGLPGGASLALIGHNGAGKTSLMKMILGLTRPTGGDLRVLGVRPSEAGLDYRRQVGFLPENVAFHDELTGTQTLAFYARLKQVDLSLCGGLLERVGLTAAAKRRVKTYSKGMRQRLGLAQALLGAPRLMLLDEPTTGLDPALRAEFFQIVRELAGRGATVILSSHILTELEARTDLVAIMAKGRLAAFGPLDELRRRAALPVRIRISSVNGVADILARLGDLSREAIIDANKHTADMFCRMEDKMPVLARLTAVGEGLADIDIHPPGLDELYRHFTSGVAAPS